MSKKFEIFFYSTSQSRPNFVPFHLVHQWNISPRMNFAFTYLWWIVFRLKNQSSFNCRKAWNIFFTQPVSLGPILYRFISFMNEMSRPAWISQLLAYSGLFSIWKINLVLIAEKFEIFIYSTCQSWPNFVPFHLVHQWNLSPCMNFAVT